MNMRVPCDLNVKNIHMKRLILFSSLLVFSVISLQAKSVDFQKAAGAAAKVIGESPTQGGINVFTTPESRLTLVKSASEESNFYVFNEADGNGFVIVSGDDVAKPILGYSDKGSFDENNLPLALVYWLDFLNSEIVYAVENNFPTNSEWENSSGFKTLANAVVGPLLSTTWGQDAPYNNMCPPISSVNALTGCVATAMAQVMKYYEYPPQGIGSTPAYQTSDNLYVPSVNVAAVTYDWENMLDSYPFPSSGSIMQRNAVAQLMYHCGVSVQMDYGLDGSSASTRNVAVALLDYFDYDPSISYKQREYYSSMEWDDFLRQQLDAGMPVIYSGRNSNSGHSFICDGYRDDGTFHFNWGWNGSRDGYFITTALNPGSGGSGSGAGTYNNDQYILINIKPFSNGTVVNEMVMWSKTNMSSTVTQIDKNTNFSVTTSYINRGFSTFTGHVGIALVDEDDRILAILGISPALNTNPNYGNSGRAISVSVPNTIPGGNYKMKTVAITTTDTTFIRASEGYVGELPVTVIQPTTAVSLNTSAIMLGVDRTYQLIETVLPANATNKAVTWSSDNNSVATVQNGLVTAHGAGTAIITVKTVDGNYTANCTVTIRASTVTLNPVSGTLPGESTLTEAIAGGGVELPEAMSCNSEWEFAGWSFNKITVQIELEDELDITVSLIPAGLYIPENDVTLFAVYKKYVEETVIYISQITCETTSTHEMTNVELSVYPNPAEDIVYVLGEKVLSVEIKDLSGSTIKQSNKTVISIKDLQSGIYFFVIQTEDRIVTKKIVKK